MLGLHPIASSPGGPRLNELAGDHPDRDSVRSALWALHVGLQVTEGATASLRALIDGPDGRVEIR